MKNYTFLFCIILLISMIPSSAIQVADAKSAEEESEPAMVGTVPPFVITNSIGMKLKLIEPGEFMMGSDKGRDHEKPVHKVKITKPFYIGVYEVTQAQYREIMRNNTPKSNTPVRGITWNSAMSFCKKLSEKEGVKYRLPTEAEWEYACRAGTKTEYYWGDEMDGDYAWYCENSEEEPSGVGQKKPNAWGLYDTSGNVNEWCSDWYGFGYYRNSPEKDPQGPKDGKARVFRGGSWGGGPAWRCRSASRNQCPPNGTNSYIGFRVVLVPE